MRDGRERGTGEVPLSWRKPFEEKIARLSRDPGKGCAVENLRARATKRYLERLDELVHYVETSTLIEGDEAREMILEKLAHARAAWQGQAGAPDGSPSPGA